MIPTGALPDLPGAAQAVQQAAAVARGQGPLVVALVVPYGLAALAVIANFVRGLVRDGRRWQ